MTEPTSTAIPVRAGPLSGFAFDDELRYVRLGDVELVRRVHVAVRDADWGTVPIRMSHQALRRGRRSFELTFGGSARAGEIALDLHVAMRGSSSGRLEFRVESRAAADFDYNRIGICVYLPSELAGAGIEMTSAAGRVRGRLPALVGPQRIEGGRIFGLFPPFNGATVRAASGTRIRLAFTGDEFEIEDQRNWADASFKIYSTPLARGFPHRLRRGESLEQRMVLTAPH